MLTPLEVFPLCEELLSEGCQLGGLAVRRFLHLSALGAEAGRQEGKGLLVARRLGLTVKAGLGLVSRVRGRVRLV